MRPFYLIAAFLVPMAFLSFFLGCQSSSKIDLKIRADVVDSLVVKGRAAGIKNVDSLASAQKELAAASVRNIKFFELKGPDLFAAARLYYRADKIDTAVTLLELFFKSDTTLATKDLLFHWYCEGKRIEDAEWLFDSKIKPLNPEYPENYYEELYYAYFDNGKEPLAYALTNKAIANLDLKKAAEFVILKAELLFHRGKTLEGLAMLQQLKKEFAGDQVLGRSIETKWNCLTLLGKRAPELEPATWLDADAVRLRDLRGKVVLLDFWAPWCGPCRAIMPHMVKLYNTYHSEGLEVIGVTRTYGRFNQLGENLTGITPEEELQWLAKFKAYHNIPFPYAVAGEADGMRNALRFGVSGIPHMILIDKKGFIRFYAVGSGPASEKSLENGVIELLQESAS